MDKVKLEMDFLDELGKRFRLGIDNPKEGLDDLAIETAMEIVINKNIFESSGGSVIGVEGARFITTSVTELEF